LRGHCARAGYSDRDRDVTPGARAFGIEGDRRKHAGSVSMNCTEVLRVHAYFDGELDANEAASLEQHLGGCAGCQALLADLERTREAGRREPPARAAAPLRGAPRTRAPAHLRARIDALLDSEAAESRSRVWRARPFWWGAFAGLVTSAAAALLLLFVFVPAGCAARARVIF